MTRDDVMAKLRDLSPALKARGATHLYLFGSVSRDVARPDSDVDLFMDYDDGRAFSLFDLAGLQGYLSDELGLPVDLTTRDSLHPKLREQVEQSAVEVF